MSAQTAADIRAALALIPAASMWCQGDGGVRRNAAGITVARCVGRSLNDALAMHDTARQMRAWNALARTAGLRVGDPLHCWNDAPERTYADVRTAFQAAIAAEEASP